MLLVFFLLVAVVVGAGDCAAFPLALDQYQDSGLDLLARLQHRIVLEPLNLVVSLVFLCAILHTFFSKNFIVIANRIRTRKYKQILVLRQNEPPRTRASDHLPLPRLERKRRFADEKDPDPYHPSNFRRSDVPFSAEIFHLLGEVEAVFGIWVIVLLIILGLNISWHETITYLSHKVSYIEPMFVVVIMAIAATKPITVLSEKIMRLFARLTGGSPMSFWFTTMTIGPLLGSFITEPAAMTICAMLLARYFYAFNPSTAFSYATLGLLFVNISVGGTFSNFAAPPVLMVAAKWQWDTIFMITTFGWKALIGIVVANLLYMFVFRKEFKIFHSPSPETNTEETIPAWIILVHLFFMVWTVSNAHYPPLFIGGFLFFLAFHHATLPHQQELSIKGPLLVGFFLGGLVVHGGLQGWWIAPVLEGLSTIPLFCGALILTAFNDNAAITLLATLVPDLAPQLKYAVVAGAVGGGGLTVIANAPNPAGQSILNKYFRNGISPLYLFLGALIPTAIVSTMFLLFIP